MRTITLAATAVALSTLWSLSATAGEIENHWYVGGGLGRADVDADFDNADLGGTPIDLDIDDDSTAWRLFAGYRFNRYVGVEGGYINFDEFDTSASAAGQTAELEAEADGYTLALTGAIPLGERFAITGRAGYLFWDADAKIRVNGATLESDDESGSDVFFGAGLEFSVNDRFALRGVYDVYSLDDVDVDYIGLEAEFRF
jgi:opacity protein-like surface antigen